MLTKKFTFALAAMVAAATSFGQVRSLPAGAWWYDSIQPTSVQNRLNLEALIETGDVDIYLRRGSQPTLTAFDHRISAGTVVGRRVRKAIEMTNQSTPALTNDRWHVGVHARRRSQFSFTRTISQTASQWSHRGAVPFTGGTSFRVWAPNSTGVNVAGQFNNWSTTAGPMVSEGGGWWSVDVRGATAGQQYKFVLRNGATTIWRNDPYGRQVQNSIGNNIIFNPSSYAWQTSNFQTPAFNDMVIYQLHIGAFNDSPGGGPGTFASAINRLNDLQSLGVNAIELLPIQEFPGDFSWGYNPSHQFAVESAYGGPNGLKAFVDAANSRGIAVIGDVVHNHYGPGDLDLWRFDGWFQGNGGGIYFYNDGRANTPWGDTRPDYGRPEVRQFIRDNQSWWLNEFRMSGLRWDSTVNMRNTNLGFNPDGWNLLRTLNDDVNASQPWKINIAEDLQGDPGLTNATIFGGAGFDSQWSGFVHDMRAQITGSDDNARSMNTIRNIINDRFNNNPWQRVIYTESHDENANGKQRVTSTIDPANPAGYFAQKRSTLGAAVTLTSPGIPMLFMGQEILEDGWFADNDPVDWSKAITHGGIRNLYRDLISLRRNLTGRTNGLRGPNVNVHHLNEGAKVVAYHRWMNGGANDDVVVVANFRNTTWTNYRIGLPRPGGWSVVFNSDWNGYSPLFNNTSTGNFNTTPGVQDGMAQSGTVNLGPYSVVILAKD